MLESVINSEKFAQIIKKNLKEIIGFLLAEGIEFSILVNIDTVRFNPQLDEEITNNFNPITVFSIMGYTFETCEVDDENFYFEAGFGAQNIGSHVQVPLLGIFQIVVDETPLIINVALQEGGKKPQKTKDNQTDFADDENTQDSLNMLLSNPENQKLLDR